jgi:hypothetical protein
LLPRAARTIATGCLLLAAALLLRADSSTRTWEQKGYEDFDRGTLRNLALSSAGKLTLAPLLRPLADPQLTYIWALAEDARGNIYAGGGSPAKVVRLVPQRGTGEGGKAEVLFESKELEIHALAIDAAGNVYAATSPEPKVYKIARDGKSAVFFEPKARYIWALAFDSQGRLLVATGDKGEVFRVDSSGLGKLFFSTGETHARSLVLDRSGNAIVGTDPSGLIFRVSPEGQGFVLYQAAKKEVTAVETAPDGSIYAAAVGDKPPRVPGVPSAPQPLPVVVPGAFQPTPPPVAGGTEVYRLYPDGAPRRIWASRDDVVYALLLKPGERGLLAASGNRGKLFELHPDETFVSLLRVQATQVTALLRRRNGTVLAAASNTGKLMDISAQFEREGSFESESLDTRSFSRWGRVFWRAETAAGARVALFTRSGNVDAPDRNWSAWSPAYSQPGDRASSPGGRFLQWKAVLTSADGEKTPWLDLVEIAYLPRNLPPVIDAVEVTPGGYRFQQQAAVVPQPQPAAPQMLVLPALGQPRPPQPPPGQRFEAPANLQAQKGWQGVRWAAHDDNDDTLIYSVYIHGKDERNWKLLKDKLSDKFYSWDAAAFPDGVYYVKIVASDAPSNVETDVLTDEREGGPLLVDNTPPVISGLKVAPETDRLRIVFHAADELSTIKRAEYSLDGSDWRPMLPVNRLSDSPEEDYDFPVEAAAGEHTIAVRVYDRYENMAVARIVTR